MPLPLVMAGIGAAGSVLGGLLGRRGARAQERSARQFGQLAGQRFDQSRQDFSPFMEAGRDSLSQLQQVNSGNYTGFYDSPDYQGALDQGIEAMNRRQASVGNLASGGSSADLNAFAQQLASQNLGNYRNSLMGVSQLGAQATGQMGQLGQGYTQMQGNALMGQGNARASGYQAMGNALTGIGGIAGDYFGYQRNGGGGGMAGGTPSGGFSGPR